MAKSLRKHSTPSKGELRLSIRFGVRENGMIFMEYSEKNAKDMERETLGGVERHLSPVDRKLEFNHDATEAHSTICHQCGENEAERGSEYCTVCHVMFATLVH